jgi:hypothetical protein
MKVVNDMGRLVSIAAAAGLVITSAQAAPARQMTDLVGARGSSGESELEARGFTHISTVDGRNDTRYSYWWNSRDKNCLRVETYDGRYTAITDASRSDCNQSGSAGAAAAVGAAAGIAILGALLSHKSHDHDNGQHLTNEAHEAEYERGYNDGMYGYPYHNYGRDDTYAQGYQAGVDQRGRNSSAHSGRGGYARSVRISDIRGMDAIRAIDEIGSRGFDNVDAFSSGNTTYGVYYNRSTRQCVQMTNANGRVYDIRDIGTHPNCR